MPRTGLFLFLCCLAAFGQEKQVFEKRDYIPALDGIVQGTAQSGDWVLENGRLTQRDDSVLAAKYRLPLEQAVSNYVFTFSVRAAGPGWVGGGLHVFSTGNTRQGAYGDGSSFLVWLTRDRAYYKSGSTYLQLYRSHDDETMIQLASLSLTEALEDGLDVEIYYNAELELISLSVNGDLKLFYPVKGLALTGKELAFRALGGPVTFGSLRVLKKASGTADQTVP